MAGVSFRWQQTMLRVRDGAAAVAHYVNAYGMTLVDEVKHEGADRTSYYLAHLSDAEKSNLPAAGTTEAHKALTSTKAVLLELVHTHGTEKDETFAGYNNGNKEPNRGFGHVAMLTDDVDAACEELESKFDVKFQKKPNEGNMKGLAFALDVDGYWVEIIKRGDGHSLPNKYNFSQTMIRIKDPAKELAFFRDQLGMTVLEERHFAEWKFSLYFLASLPDRIDHQAANGKPDPMKLFNPVLELTHNHGTEDDDSSYHNGNTDPKGFGHVGFVVSDQAGALEQLKAAGIEQVSGVDAAGVFVQSPSGYYVELIPEE